jgi:hypothetical protein
MDKDEMIKEILEELQATKRPLEIQHTITKGVMKHTFFTGIQVIGYQR